ncbi:MAG: histidine kinase [Runella slithyformis]|nr:MAG: histidine kinase [Runella sp.]TAG19946.1 MAG: histidine kinase [Cytophagales bacterium]TAG40089.1 MAG: histidine kinase [Cytophagia bacterium]TAG68759.1 MAG: histidine kinase [Runella slithyformis]TAG80673.1 MAG: histidine kinase [Cytophagales bacterium]
MRLSLDIYSQKNLYQIFIGINLALIGIASLFYTYNIVENVDKRERRQLELYAELYEYSVNHADGNEDLTALLEIVRENNRQSNIPTILTGQDKKPIGGDNLEIPTTATAAQKKQLLEAAFFNLKNDHPPIEVDVDALGDKQYIYFADSSLLVQMRYYPYVQLVSIIVLSFLAYLVFSASRNAEQNRVWVGLAKETAHQLGTPIASLMGWVAFFRSDPTQFSDEYTTEIEKDVQRLEMITARFSSIGSVPIRKFENIADTIAPFLEYLKRRISTKVKLEFVNELPPDREMYLNRNLFEWVIENLCKNAVDSMGGIGEIKVRLFQLNKQEVAIDISDTGKGISRTSWRKVFRPGFSTKKRGWGLGLTLAKRIIEQYHEGKLFVKTSEVGKGTTFRIILRK